MIRNLQHQAESVPSYLERETMEHMQVKKPPKKCGYSNWSFIKSAKMHENKVRNQQGRNRMREKWNHIVITYVAGLSEELSKHDIPVHLKPLVVVSHTFCQTLAHVWDKTC